MLIALTMLVSVFVTTVNPAHAQSTKSLLPLQDTFPTRIDLSTEWKMGALTNHTSSSDGYRPTTNDMFSTLYHYPSAQYIANEGKVIHASGYQKIGLVQRYDRYGEKPMSIWIVAYAFDSRDNASAYWQSVVSDLKSSGGYTEKSITGLNDIDCYGVFYNNEGHGEDLKLFCHTANVYYHVDGYTGWSFDNSDTKTIADLTALTAARIGNGVVAPEFPTTLIVLLGSAILIMVGVVYNKRDIMRYR